MRGRAKKEIVRECVFENVTMRGHATESVTERCDVEGTIMKDVERGIYGGIVSGLNEKRGKEFRMKNSTLMNNHRERNGGTCSTSVTSNCSTSSRISLSTSTSYSFTDCTFKSCS